MNDLCIITVGKIVGGFHGYKIYKCICSKVRIIVLS